MRGGGTRICCRPAFFPEGAPSLFPMNLPNLLDNKALAKLAAPDETITVRVIIRQVFNNKPYRLRGRTRHYLADHDPKLNVHVLDVPASVWMKDFPTGTYKDNPSIAHDLQGNRMGAGMVPLLFCVIPWKGAEETKTADKPAPDAGLAELLAALALRISFNRNEERFEALATPEINRLSGLELQPRVTEILKTSGHEDVVTFLDKFWAEELSAGDVESPENTPSAGASEEPATETQPSGAMTNAERQKLYRERKKEEKAKAAGKVTAKKAAKKAATKKAKQKPKTPTA